MGCAASATSVRPEKAMRPQSFDEFQVGRTLGKGTFSCVKAGVHAPTKAKVAIKSIERSSTHFDQKMVDSEICIMQGLRHPNCVKLIDTFVLKDAVHLVMERAFGGNLFDRIQEKGPMEEGVAAFVIKQVIDAQIHLHSSGIVHRDIKPHNILFASNVEDSSSYNLVKLTDFGLAAEVEGDAYADNLDSVVGTAQYAAPEMLRIAVEKKSQGLAYGAKVDMWSTGCTLFHMLAGETPFGRYADKTILMVRNIIKGDFKFDALVWESVSKEAMDFVCMLMSTEPKQRPTAREAMLWGKVWLSQARSSATGFSSSSRLSEASTVALSDTGFCSEQSSASTVTRKELLEHKPSVELLQNAIWGKKATSARGKGRRMLYEENEQCLDGF
mmetsp:Transcript_19587/g.30689  ORF Transcript_19587/g.30689 Transcript_19587/m.30689 type:complete len:385 (+) Transcript_19587:168-1322(+)|eukprot:CAMPEP_0184314030 /NCGR_PEP_ID=MMETSP1049-20130417/70372_1 /TAXON_ID=77928 /ORGANISM="Proteomonas sulcata, Strain CCMP704" /LENGTH=384 /DNA_ID=CAMNT_0026631721 /DNA_START=103 /DNA_END=1257 /DNA_ORIENTATION=+